MSTAPARRLRFGAPELISLVCLIGLGWWLWPRPPAPPPPTPSPDRICGTERAEFDCFLPVPAGTFLMGAQADDRELPGYDPYAEPTEGPPHLVTVSALWVTRTEGSVSLYQHCVEAGACSLDDLLLNGGFSTYQPLNADVPYDPANQMPLNNVSWEGANKACAWIGGRLPTEAEWEYIARGTTGRRWAWGDHESCAILPADVGFARLELGAAAECAQDGPNAVDTLPEVGVFGTSGMSGNLWEWTSDWYAADAYAHHAATNPTGPATGTTRAQRGGSWLATSPKELRTTVRGGLDPEARLNDTGFRCVFGGKP